MSKKRANEEGSVYKTKDGRVIWMWQDANGKTRYIKPLGEPHNEPDVAANVLVICPSHHALCDYGAIELDLAKLRQEPAHQTAPEYVSYHNTELVREFFLTPAQGLDPLPHSRFQPFQKHPYLLGIIDLLAPTTPD